MRAGRLLFLLCLLLAALLAGGCLSVPDDQTQIRDLIEDRSKAEARRDARRIYRMQDPDFRAVCAYATFRTLPFDNPAAVQEVRDIEVRGVRGSATVVLRTVDGTREEQRAFVKDAGRWYLYEDAGPCLAAAPAQSAHLALDGARAV